MDYTQLAELGWETYSQGLSIPFEQLEPAYQRIWHLIAQAIVEAAAEETFTLTPEGAALLHDALVDDGQHIAAADADTTLLEF